MIGYIILFVLGLALIGWAVNLSYHNWSKLDVFVGVIGGVVLMLGVRGVDTANTPSALDVYRGRTLLEINTSNGVATDSVVVWKEEWK